MVRVLFVCMGNICRSPTAEGVFKHLLDAEGLAEHVSVDSAGTHAYHVGNPPDPRAQESARNRGFALEHLRARRVGIPDFELFDYVLAMDRDNLAILEQLCPIEHRHKMALLLSFAPEVPEAEVPDPYYGGPRGFERVLDMIEAASQGLLQHIRERHNLPRT